MYPEKDAHTERKLLEEELEARAPLVVEDVLRLLDEVLLKKQVTG